MPTPHPQCTLLLGDAKQHLQTYHHHFDLIITSPPYADSRKQYDHVKPDAYTDWFLTLHQPLWDSLKDSGSLVINIKSKIVSGVRHRYVWHLIEALAQAGWLCVDDFIWHKNNPYPGRWSNRLKDGWEYIFHLTKQKHTYFNADAVKKSIGSWHHGRNRPEQKSAPPQPSASGSGFGAINWQWNKQSLALPSNVIQTNTENRNKKHPAVFPVALPDFFIRLLCPPDGIVCDPFAGSGTTAVAALRLHRNIVLIDKQKAYLQIAEGRIKTEVDHTDFSLHPFQHGQRPFTATQSHKAANPYA